MSKVNSRSLQPDLSAMSLYVFHVARFNHRTVICLKCMQLCELRTRVFCHRSSRDQMCCKRYFTLVGPTAWGVRFGISPEANRLAP